MKKQFHLYWGNIPNQPGSNRPYLVLSRNEANNSNVMVAPVRSVQAIYITSIPLNDESYPFKKKSSIELSQITTMESDYLDGEICKLSVSDSEKVKEILKHLFCI